MDHTLPLLTCHVDRCSEAEQLQNYSNTNAEETRCRLVFLSFYIHLSNSVLTTDQHPLSLIRATPSPRCQPLGHVTSFSWQG
jgi:hypothetical protein